MLQGVTSATQKCQKTGTPKFLQGVMLRTQQCHTSITSKGAIPASRQRHFLRAPASFIWCQLRIAAMPFEQRTKGRASIMSQKYQRVDALPTQFNGDTDMTQQCLDHNSPRERSWKDRRNATIVPPLPTSYRGPHFLRRSAIVHSPPPNLGHLSSAETPSVRRPITRGQVAFAEMPFIERLAT